MKRTVAALLLLATMLTPAYAGNGVRNGFAAHYRVGAMERAARHHGLPQVRCMVATSYYPLGTWLTVTSNVTNRTLQCRVSDVTQERHVAAVRRRGIVIEFGAANIWEMCALRKVGAEPPRKCPVSVQS